MKRTFARIYKGYSDIFGVISFIAGVIFLGLGVLLFLCTESVSVLLIAIGAMLIYLADDLFRYGRT